MAGFDLTTHSFSVVDRDDTTRPLRHGTYADNIFDGTGTLPKNCDSHLAPIC
jgi:hypothetical protein